MHVRRCLPCERPSTSAQGQKGDGTRKLGGKIFAMPNGRGHWPPMAAMPEQAATVALGRCAAMQRAAVARHDAQLGADGTAADVAGAVTFDYAADGGLPIYTTASQSRESSVGISMWGDAGQADQGSAAGEGGAGLNAAAFQSLQDELVSLRDLATDLAATLDAHPYHLDTAALLRQQTELRRLRMQMIDLTATLKPPTPPDTPVNLTASAPVDLTASGAVPIGSAHTSTPHTHTHRCKRCGKTGTCARTMSGNVLRMANHRCSDGKTRKFNRIGDLMPDRLGQFVENDKVIRAAAAEEAARKAAEEKGDATDAGPRPGACASGVRAPIAQ